MKFDTAQILQNELSRRCRSNPRYSLRALARTLGVSPANLSLILSRKRPASMRTVERMLSRLDLGPREREVISGIPLAIELEENLDLKIFEQVSTWIAYAILSLLKTKSFKKDERYIAKRLGVTQHEVRAALSSLRQAGLLRDWERTASDLRLNNPISTSITRAFQRQLIERSIQSMENDPSTERDISSITFAMNKNQFQEAQDEIRRFRLRMAKIFEKPGEATDVYNLTVQLVPVTRGEIK